MANQNPNETVSEKAKRIETALKYTDGDMEQAKFMAAGKLQDVVAIKGKFVVPELNQSGAFIAFINTSKEYISSIKSVLTLNTGTYSKMRIFDDWRVLLKNIEAYLEGGDVADSGLFTGNLLESMIKRDVFPDVQKMNLEYLAVALQDMIKDFFKSEKAKCQIELEKTTSMDIELAGIEVMLPENGEAEASEADPQKQQQQQQQEIRQVPDTPFRRHLGEIESKASLVVEGCCVLSPVKGKPISEIQSGERILVSLTSGDSVSEKIIDAYKARDHEGKPLPIVGRIVEIVPNEEIKGVIIYVLVAKGIYAKIVEEEPVRIQTELTYIASNGSLDDESMGQKNWVTVLVSAFFVLLIIALIVVLIFVS
ncbi:MAG TPA: hypothetical protein PK906_02510 [Spirochaetota bacterium]|nr:hypothetical protein [Spirochaetota bacterium]